MKDINKMFDAHENTLHHDLDQLRSAWVVFWDSVNAVLIMLIDKIWMK